MHTSPLLDISRVSKCFRLYPRPSDRFWEALRGGCRHTEHQALKDVSFSLDAGDALGILGENGAGKSTLLKLVTGVLMPDSGKVSRHGLVTGLLELGTGFDERLTGRENLAINASLLGLSPADIAAQRDAIIDFAELGSFIDAPLRTFSTGMVMRLGFAIAIHAHPACLVVDEALSVGDVRFQQKCLAAIEAFRANGGALLFVSHDINLVKRLCDRALILSGGRVVHASEPHGAAKFYQRLMMREDKPSATLGRFGLGEVRLQRVVLIGEDGLENRLFTGEMAELLIELSALRDHDNLALGFMIQDRLGQDIYGTNTALQRTALTLRAGCAYRVSFRFRVHLGFGEYSVNVGLHDRHHHYRDVQDWWNESLSIQVVSGQNNDFAGICYQPVAAVRITPIPPPEGQFLGEDAELQSREITLPNA